MKHNNGWNTQIASDIHRDGLGVELLGFNGEIVAEVFRCDADNSIVVTCWSRRVTDDVLNWLLPYSETELQSFEDGTPLPPSAEWQVERDP
ncbi:hypothetical protein Poly51_40140 [Rubripirellula tenax]|uniref:Uncharacterized protein n=1 Tax=Rubripirellula tenax TaxID=2528015 RepID=A0A5C6ETQ8_9BACT|nr:hypothetical protein [Rubripirellula tenax]TWU50721.1 hypothetical protein Poly51_40140 [Rubripirellula tenax]